jgi:hypothetical protein
VGTLPNDDKEVNNLGSTAGRIPTIILWSAAAWAFALSLYGLYSGRLAYSVLLLALAVILIAALRLPGRRRAQAALVLCSLLIPTYLAELVVGFALPFRAGLHAWMENRPYDFRTYHRVVRDLRLSGDRAYPSLFPRALLNEKSFTASFLPLGDISAGTTVYCNEGGDYLIYRSDEYGFHNPAGIWESALDIAAVGDSFTQGACVASESNFVSRIRQRHPYTLNLGMGGNGPLLALAGMQEYLADLEPKLVLWFFFEGNDLEDLPDEFKDARLRRYLEDSSFRQNLTARQPDIDESLRQLADTTLSLDSDAAPLLDSVTHRQDFRTTLVRVARLSHLRGLLNRLFDDPLGYSERQQTAQVELLCQTLLRARNLVESWDGQLLFVILPSWELAVQGSDRRRRVVNATLAAADTAGVATLNLGPSFRQQPDPAGDFVYPGSHYSEAGHGLVADEVLKQIASQRISSE